MGISVNSNPQDENDNHGVKSSPHLSVLQTPRNLQQSAGVMAIQRECLPIWRTSRREEECIDRSVGWAELKRIGVQSRDNHWFELPEGQVNKWANRQQEKI